jgi:hypothetical protein
MHDSARWRFSLLAIVALVLAIPLYLDYLNYVAASSTFTARHWADKLGNRVAVEGWLTCPRHAGGSVW